MKNHQNELISKAFDRGNGEYRNLLMKNCEFNNCGISLTAEINQRSTVSNIEIIDCKTLNCAIGPAIITDAHISNLATGDLQILWGTLFNRVKIDGKIGRLKINTRIHAPDATEAQQKHNKSILTISGVIFTEILIGQLISEMLTRNSWKSRAFPPKKSFSTLRIACRSKDHPPKNQF